MWAGANHLSWILALPLIQPGSPEGLCTLPQLLRGNRGRPLVVSMVWEALARSSLLAVSCMLTWFPPVVPSQPLLLPPLQSPSSQDDQLELWSPKEAWGFPKKRQALWLLFILRKWMTAHLFSVWAKINNRFPVSVCRLYLASWPARALVLPKVTQDIEWCKGWQKHTGLFLQSPR